MNSISTVVAAVLILTATVLAVPRPPHMKTQPVKGESTIEYYAYNCDLDNNCVSDTPFVVNPNTGTKICFSHKAGSTRSLLAHAIYERTTNKTGWGVLSVDTFANNDPKTAVSDVGFALGVAEVASYLDDLILTMANSYAFYNKTLDDFRKANEEYMNEQINNHQGEPFWLAVTMGFHTFQGMEAAALKLANISNYDMWMQTAQGDLMDLMAAFNIPMDSVAAERGIKRYSPDTVRARLGKEKGKIPRAYTEHCSGLVKLKSDMSDLYVAHATWSTYNSMLRVFKHYSIEFPERYVKANHDLPPKVQVSFSSYPGVPVSIDDFYVTSAGLAVFETSFSVDNNTIYRDNITPKSLLFWMRAFVSNTLADNVKSWSKMFCTENSGTYNNQWVIVDYKQFSPTMSVVENLMGIVEQIPGSCVSNDMSRVLALGYWPSYNIPYNTELYYALGNSCEGKSPSCFEANDYNRASRAQIFRREQASVKDLESMKYLMQYNHYQTDPASYGDPTNTVASRGDLSKRPGCWGAIDAKISSYTMFVNGDEDKMDRLRRLYSNGNHRQMTEQLYTSGNGNNTRRNIVAAFSGPTPQQAPFSFSKMPPKSIMCRKVVGLPDTWTFNWVNITSPNF